MAGLFMDGHNHLHKKLIMFAQDRTKTLEKIISLPLKFYQIQAVTDKGPGNFSYPIHIFGELGRMMNKFIQFYKQIILLFQVALK